MWISVFKVYICAWVGIKAVITSHYIAVWVSTVVTKFWLLILVTAPPVNYVVLWLQFTAVCAWYPPEWKTCFNSNIFLYFLSFFIQEHLIIHVLFWKIWLVQVLSCASRYWLHHQIVSNCPFLKCTQGLTLRRLMSYIYIYIYGAPILDVSRSYTTTQHSRKDSSGRVISSSQRSPTDCAASLCVI